MNPDPAATAGVTIVAADEVRRGASETVLPARPFPGLRPFRIDEWPIFFGREVMTEEVIERLLEHRVVVVHGNSGCGKSSLVYAGVLPQLARRIGRRRNLLRIAQMRPGQAPLQTMAAALAVACESADVDGLHRMVAKGAAGAEELRRLIEGRGDERLCLFVDQFEELFRFARQGSAAEAELFTDFLIGLADNASEEEQDGPGEASERPRRGHVRLIVTMRSEFLGDCARYPGLAQLINRAQYLLPMMTRADLVRAVREPAELFGAEIPHDLADRLVEEALDESDPLPLMQHALMRLWSEGPQAMTLARYQALAADDAEEGGSGAGLCRFLAAHANEVLDTAAGRDDPDAELLFRALTDIDAEGRGIRRPQQLGRLLALVEPAERDKVRRVIDAFRAEDASFLRPFESERDAPLDEAEMIDISHEALLRAWPRIADASIDPTTGRPRGWLHREIEDGLVWRALAVQARLFEADGSSVLDAATTGRRDAWYDSFGGRPDWAERHLILRTGAAPEDEPEWRAVGRLMTASRRARARRRLRRRLLRLGLALLILGIVAALIWLYIGSRRTLEASETQLDQVEAAEQKSAEVSRAAYLKAGDPDRPPEVTAPVAPDEANVLAPSGTEIAYVWVGSEPGRSPPLGVSARMVTAGRVYRTSVALTARSGMPGANCALAAGSGYVPENTNMRILQPPTTCRSETGRQYWAQAQGRIRPFATVFIQFFGGEAEESQRTQAQSESRLRAGRIAAEVQRYGYRVPPQDREASAAGLAEVRYFHRDDRGQAVLLADNARAIARRNPQLAPLLARVRAVDLTRSPRRTPLGTLELWLDISRPAEAAPAASQTAE